MNISLDAPNADLFIKAYTPGSLTLNTSTCTHSIVMYKNQCERWPVSHINDLTTENVSALLVYQADIILLGTGKEHIFPDHNVLAPALQAGIGIDIMNTEAACRTYTILLSEGRDVLLALIV